jgi:hypothetical protein
MDRFRPLQPVIVVLWVCFRLVKQQIAERATMRFHSRPSPNGQFRHLVWFSHLA